MYRNGSPTEPDRRTWSNIYVIIYLTCSSPEARQESVDALEHAAYRSSSRDANRFDYLGAGFARRTLAAGERQ
jgi:hypothetical protein